MANAKTRRTIAPIGTSFVCFKGLRESFLKAQNSFDIKRALQKFVAGDGYVVTVTGNASLCNGLVFTLTVFWQPSSLPCQY